MFDIFKNLELTRHHMSAKFDKTIAEQAEKDASGTEQILAGVFSAALSLLFSYVIDTRLINPAKNVLITPWLNTILIALLIGMGFVILFIVFFYGFKVAYKSVCKYHNDRKIHSPDYSRKSVKAIIDDFDIIAFNNLLASFEFIEHIEDDEITNDDKEIITYYFHELIYYLRTSIQKTQKILEWSELCVNSNKKVDAVDLFRIFNANALMKNIINVVHNILNRTCAQPVLVSTYDERLGNILKLQIADLEKDICKIEEQCLHVLDSNYPPG